MVEKAKNNWFYWKIVNVSLRKNTAVLKKAYFCWEGLPCPYDYKPAFISVNFDNKVCNARRI